MVLLQALVALAVFVGVGFVVWATFDFLRDADANRLVVVGVALVVGVGGVFALFWAMNRFVDFLPGRLAEGVRPYVFIGPALVMLAGVPGLSGDQHDLISFKDANGQECVGLDNYEFVFTDESMLRSMRNTASVDRARAARRGRASVSCSRRWPTGCAAARRSRSR